MYHHIRIENYIWREWISLSCIFYEDSCNSGERDGWNNIVINEKQQSTSRAIFQTRVNRGKKANDKPLWNSPRPLERSCKYLNGKRNIGWSNWFFFFYTNTFFSLQQIPFITFILFIFIFTIFNCVQHIKEFEKYIYISKLQSIIITILYHCFCILFVHSVISYYNIIYIYFIK